MESPKTLTSQSNLKNSKAGDITLPDFRLYYRDIYLYVEIYNMYIKEYYLAIKKKKLLLFVTTWMNLEGVMLSKISERNTNAI